MSDDEDDDSVRVGLLFQRQCRMMADMAIDDQETVGDAFRTRLVCRLLLGWLESNVRVEGILSS